MSTAESAVIYRATVPVLPSTSEPPTEEEHGRREEDILAAFALMDDETAESP